MGFEVVYRFLEKNEEGDYNKDDVKEMSRKIGEPFEDVSLETLAQKIMAQMARRDIYVLPDVEIYELKKQKVSFRETKGGVIIKNKKFLLDNENNSIICQDMPETPVPALPVQQLVQHTPQNGTMAPHNTLVLHNQQQGLGRRPIKIVVLDDSGWTQDMHGNKVPVGVAIKNAGLQFRANQRYPVMQEMDDPRDKRVDKFGQPTLDRKKVYLMLDDNKREVTVSQDYFVPADIKLERSVADDPWDKVTGGGKEPKLMFEQEFEENMFDIRAKK